MLGMGGFVCVCVCVYIYIYIKEEKDWQSNEC